ncbi:DNA-binding SARP family transcriptional activator/tetratricopeptide (TPR) repeat protein/CheY-like chemotaxis protein [Streptacidiphilus sp. MAP12-20]|uniref:AfsR/SARP family transcriptional regulator n=1 Tax=Streptacidiphilus sp. MAP12-20 TaxID=3156299 RepID=UPI0035143298
MADTTRHRFLRGDSGHNSHSGHAVMDSGRLRVETLGPLRACVGEREVVLGPPKQRAVFAVLALRADSIVSRDDLIDCVWGESAPATAAGSLHTYVSGLRRALAGPGGQLTSSGPGYVLHLDREQLDVGVVEALTARARTSRTRRDQAAAVTALDEALACWRPGSALGGLPGPFAADHRTWASELRFRLMLERAELLLELDQPSDVADQLRGVVRDNPYHERLRAVLMRALHRSGQTAVALAHYHDLRKLLADDLGIDPSADSQALYSEILADNADPRTALAGPAALAAVAGPVRPAQLPRGVGCFVGRVPAVRQLLDAARTASDGDESEATCPQIAMVVGVGGVGKTALAVHCAHLLAAAYPDGQLYLNLRGFDPRHPASSPTDALHHLLSSVHAGTIPADQQERVALWRSIVRDRKLLIVLDNAESADQVEDLLPGGGPSFTVVTSRNRLSGLAVRYSARRVTVTPFSAEESLELLSHSIGGARVGAEPSAARRLADLCDHLPLALRIASEQVTAGPRSRIADLVADLEDVRRRLDALEIPDDELSSMRGVLSWSYARLDAAAAHGFRMLGLFPGVGIRMEVAAELLDVPPSAAAAVLRSLAAQHLVAADGGGYRMHDLTRLYAEEVSRTGEAAESCRQALERVVRWYVRTLAQGLVSGGAELPFALASEALCEPLPVEERKDLVGWCAREWDNIAPLVRRAQRIGCHEQAWQLAYLLFDYFHAAGRAGEWVDVLRIGLRSAELTENRHAQAVLLDHLSVAHSRLGQQGAALQQLRRGLGLAEALGDDVLRAGLLGSLAATLRATEDHAAALRHAREALVLARRIGSAHQEARSRGVLCDLHVELGEFEESLRHAQAGLAAARRCRNPRLEADLLVSLAVSEHGLGHPERAVRYFRLALSLCASSGDHYHEALALFGLAVVHRRRSARQRAHALATRALLRLKELDAEEAADVTDFLRALDADPRPAAPPVASESVASESVRRVG